MEITKLFQLKPKEEIEQVVRVSGIAAFPRFALLGLLFVLPFFFFFPLMRQGVVGVTFFVVIVLVILFFLFREYFRWDRTVLVVTDRRIVDIEQKGFFYKVVSEAPFSQIDEVTYRKKGIGQTLFGFGTLKIHMHGSGADIEFERLPRPAAVYDLINDLRLEHAEE